jgi:AcrR family transcriptional regulator
VSVDASTEQLGLRERNKLDKLRRIKAASRELFIAKGFDDTTIREIAARADVGMGTVFLYADNKRDLLFLIANDELEAITEKAIAGFRPDNAVLANLMRAFRPHYEFFGEQPELSRFKLREMMFYDSGKQANRFQATRERLAGLLTSIIAAGQERSTIKRSEDAAFIGVLHLSSRDAPLAGLGFSGAAERAEAAGEGAETVPDWGGAQ